MSMNIGGPTRQVEQILSDLRAENARLQAYVKQLKGFIRNPAGYRGTTMPTECPMCGQDGVAETERDRLQTALENIRDAPHAMTHCRLVEKFVLPAIDITPEEAREKK